MYLWDVNPDHLQRLPPIPHVIFHLVDCVLRCTEDFKFCDRRIYPSFLSLLILRQRAPLSCTFHVTRVRVSGSVLQAPPRQVPV